MSAACCSCGGPVPVPAYLSHLTVFRCSSCSPADADILPIAIERATEAAKPGSIANKTVAFSKGYSTGLAHAPKRRATR